MIFEFICDIAMLKKLVKTQLFFLKEYAKRFVSVSVFRALTGTGVSQILFYFYLSLDFKYFKYHYDGMVCKMN